MKIVLSSKGFKIFAVIITLYTAVTFFLTDFECLTNDYSGFCGVISGLANVPANIVASPVIFLIGAPGIHGAWPVPIALLYFLSLVLGWLVFGAIVGWIISKIRSKYQTTEPATKKPRSILIQYIIIALAIAAIGSIAISLLNFNDSRVVFAIIPLIIISISVFIIGYIKYSKAKSI